MVGLDPSSPIANRIRVLERRGWQFVAKQADGLYYVDATCAGFPFVSRAGLKDYPWAIAVEVVERTDRLGPRPQRYG